MACPGLDSVDNGDPDEEPLELRPYEGELLGQPAATGVGLLFDGVVGADTGEVGEGDREPARLGNHEQDPIALFESPGPHRFLEHDEDAGGTGIALGMQVGEPLLLRDHQAGIAHEFDDVAVEVVGAVMAEKMIDPVRIELAGPDQVDVLLDTERNDVVEHRDVLTKVEHSGPVGRGRRFLVLPGASGRDTRRGSDTGVHAERVAMGVGTLV